MRAIVQDRFGPPDEVLRVEERPTPTVGPDDVLVRVRAASVGAWVSHMVRCDIHMLRIGGAGLRRPKRETPGGDLAGVVEAVGANVEDHVVGDEVYGWADGAFAELVAVPASDVGPKPTTMTFEEAAAVPIAAHTALLGLREHGGLEPGQQVLIIGGSGGVGTYAVQIASALGAEVTAVCGPANLDLVASLGADHVLSYTDGPPTRGGRAYDVIFQVAGAASIRSLRSALTREGVLVLCSGEGNSLVGPGFRVLAGLAMSPFISQSVKVFIDAPDKEGLSTLTQMIEAGQFRSVVDRVYPLEQAGAAIRHFDDGHPSGKVVVSIG